MPDPRPKTISEHAEFLREMVKLHLWFLWTWLRRHPEEGFSKVIRTRIDIFRKTDLNKGPSKNTYEAGDFTLPRWLEVEAQAERLCRESASAEEFERRAWEVFRPLVEARVERDFAEGDMLDNYQCGSLRYNVPKPGETRVDFHIANRIAPRSIFDDPTYLPGCFTQMFDALEPHGVTEIGTTTWLNTYPKWLALFPREWHDHMTLNPNEVGWSLGHWGQFVSARGTFNHRHGQLLRRLGELPFKSRKSWCTIAAMREHLRRR